MKSQIRYPKQYSIEQFLDTVSIMGASLSSDGEKVLFSSNKTGIYNVYSVPAAGGESMPLTTSTTDSTYAVSYFPNDDRILYTRDHAGDEKNHLFVKEIDGSELDLTPGGTLKASFVSWSHSGDVFYVQSNERDPRFFDLYQYSADGYARSMLFQNDGGHEIARISNDGHWLALVKPYSTSDTDILLWDALSRRLINISEHRGTAEYLAQSFDAESKSLYYTTNDGGEFLRLMRYEMATGKHEEVERNEWDIVSAFFSHNGRYRVSTVNADARTVMQILDTRTGEPVVPPGLPSGEISSGVIARTENKMAFLMDTDRGPADLYVWDFGPAMPTRLTKNLNPQIDVGDLVESKVVRFPSFDGLTIPNILYKPHQAIPEAKAPALVLVHGGPGGQTRRNYGPGAQYLANHGYVVLGINNRGSSGYGKTFFTADDKRHGREPLWDCVAAKKYLQGLPYVDKDRIGIIGSSYGGYMVLAALTFQPDEFNVGVDVFGVANWVRVLESIPKWWEAARLALYEEIGDPVKDRDMLISMSPLFHAGLIRKPLMVLQGANDPRVIKAESDDIVAAVKKNGVPVEYMVFDDEGHGFTKKKNNIEGWKAILRFLDKHLMGVQV